SDDPVWACVSEVAFHEFIPPVAGIVQDRSVPGKRAVGDPVLVLVCDVAETIPGDRVDVPIGAEEADDSLGLLKGLDGSIEQDSIKAAIMETDVILRVLKEGVHGESSSGFAFAGRIILTDAFAISRGLHHANKTAKGKDVSGSAGRAESARVCARGLP